jgi:hypothetical protein
LTKRARKSPTGESLYRITNDCASIVNFIGQQDAQDVIVRGVEMREISYLSLLPVCLPLAFGCIGKAVRACRYYVGHTIPESERPSRFRPRPLHDYRSILSKKLKQLGRSG